MNALFKPKLIAGNSNRPLATSIARRISMHRGETVELVKTRVERFNDAEIFVEVYENVRGEDMFIIQSTSNPANDNLMELLIMCDALRRSSARRITAVMPYFGYARQDRRSKARTPISAKLVANLLTVAGIGAGADAGPSRGADSGVLRPAGRQPLCRAGVRARHPAQLHATSRRSPWSRPTSAGWRGRASSPSASAPTSPSWTSAARSRRGRLDDGDRRGRRSGSASSSTTSATPRAHW